MAVLRSPVLENQPHVGNTKSVFCIIFGSHLPFILFDVSFALLYALWFSVVSKSLGKEMEASSEGERLVFPFVGKMYDVSNAALFYAHNGRLDTAQEQLKGKHRGRE